ncbi:MAG TPA: DUF362 domain-containing protein [Tepidisphaeraceae bacterium]|nr:DUF362 domain-containing protein [Tepidisphaeraceae bacterium]
MTHHFTASRRQFLRGSLLGGIAAMGGLPLSASSMASEEAPAKAAARVTLTTGDSRVDNTFRALQPFAKQVAEAIGNRRVVIKPNNVSNERQLAATHVEQLEGILEFLKSIKKIENVVIAESAANGPTMTGFDNFGYTRLAGKYNVKLLDLDQQEIKTVHVFDEKDFRPHAVRMSALLLDDQNFVISAAKLKTHDRVLATLSLKNIVFGAPIKDPNASWNSTKIGSRSDKPIAHGSGIYGINYNLYALAPRLRPHLAVIDGFEGMEGNGPVGGTAVQHRVCVASTDWLAADRVGVELMGIDFAKVGYLNYCAQTGLGEADLKKIEIIGESIAKHIKKYKLADNIDKQLQWMKVPQQA